MYYVGIDVSEYKQDCTVLDDSGEIIINDFAFANTAESFSSFQTLLPALASPDEIKIGFEAIGHYTSNLRLFLEKARHSFMESKPALIGNFTHAQTLRHTKNDAMDSRAIARWLMWWNTNPIQKDFATFIP